MEENNGTMKYDKGEVRLNSLVVCCDIRFFAHDRTVAAQKWGRRYAIVKFCSMVKIFG